MSAHIQSMWAGLTSWLVGLTILLGAYSDTILKILGFVLVVARLAQEIPKLIDMYKHYKNKRRFEDE